LALNGFDFAMITKFHASLSMREGEFFEGKWDRVVMAMPPMSFNLFCIYIDFLTFEPRTVSAVHCAQ
jgi:uncharacterized membrane protein